MNALYKSRRALGTERTPPNSGKANSLLEWFLILVLIIPAVTLTIKDGTHKENDKDQVFKDKDKNKHLTYDL